MKYFYEKPLYYASMYGETYECGHPVYSKSTLFKIENKGLAVIQQQYESTTKHTWWSEVEPWLTDRLYLHPNFRNVFSQHSGECKDGLYPTITVRQLMWAMRMKPLKRQPWETVFDRKDI